ncbi:hypothetical protein [Erythrobacter sp. EC-HK427]
MKTLRIAALLPAIALIAACGGEAQEPAPTSDNPPALAESADEQLAAAVPEDVVATPAAAEGAIPAQFIGVWDYIEGTCDPASDMRLEISQDSLVFYESVGQVRSAQADGDTLRVDLAMSGEGESWRDQLQFTLMDDGTLHRVDAAAPDAVDEYPRKRCDG